MKKDSIQKQERPTSLNNEKGSVLVLALLLLAVLTVVGLSSINMSVTEYKIVGNERVYQNNFYRAESAALEAAKRLDLIDVEVLRGKNFSGYPWLNTQDDVATEDGDDGLADTSNWEESNSDDASVLDNTKFAVVEKGIAKGTSLDVTQGSNVYEYVVRGYAHDNGGRVLIEIGYKIRH